ncbi:FACT complex subunit POB3 [Trichoderma asperellum]|uniref:FACT complex subunit POB3 n=1 Tax=Trichoderma asperellum TaxID=101201 RepID=A0A6V8R4C5_TRIAP|nr:FACT complex subunit POB3 [Trichoderma asperellum]
MAWLSRPLTLVGLVLLAHGCYSAHEHTVLSSTSAQHSTSPSTTALPLDIYIETAVATFLLCVGLVLGSGTLKPIEWHTWAGKIEREADRSLSGSGDADDATGNPFSALEARSGFINIHKLHGDFVNFVSTWSEAQPSAACATVWLHGPPNPLQGAKRWRVSARCSRAEALKFNPLNQPHFAQRHTSSDFGSHLAGISYFASLWAARMTAIESFDSIYLDLSKESGKCRFAETGFGWKPAGGGDTFTLDHSNIGSAQWSRAARGYEIRILQRNSGIIQLDGFQQEDYERLSKIFKNWYSTVLESKEHALRGWNWGKAEFSKSEITFNVQNRPAFELPYSEIGNTNLAGRNEVAVELSLPLNANDTGTNGQLGGARGKGKKAGAGKDQLVEMRFYIPGVTTKKETEGEDAGSDGGEEEEKNAATLFYETLIEKAEIGETAGDTIATFLDVLHLTPRGRFDIDMYEASFRLRGKTYDYKIQYEAVKKFMVLPKPDEMHCLLCIGLDPPLRQGQTRYPFVVMQFKKDEEVTIDLNIDEAELESKYKDKLEPHYEEPLHHVVAKMFRGLGNKKISSPAKDFLTHRNQYGIKCSIKASEGFLYCLEKAFMFVPKPATYIAYEQTQSVTFSRVSGAVSALSTFDITVVMKNGAGSSQFSNINREDLKALESFFKLKGLRVKNEIDEDANLLAAALREEAMDDSDDEVVVNKADRGSADEDEESVDEDFQADSDSDVAEEYDSNHESSGSGSAESDVDDDEDDDEEMEDVDDEPPKKKSKTGKK